MAIPSMPRETNRNFTRHTRNRLDEYESCETSKDAPLNEKQKAILINIQDQIDAIGTPAARLERGLHLPVALLIIPLFALANAGISIDFSSLGTTMLEPISLGIIAGLILGKVMGIFGVAWLAIKLKIAELPKKSSMQQIFGVAFLGAIGFTMSIFVADLAFVGQEELIFQAKIGILLASLFAGLFGYFWLRIFSKEQ
jgi:NhaA family Na+:H+ antiporter